MPETYAQTAKGRVMKPARAITGHNMLPQKPASANAHARKQRAWERVTIPRWSVGEAGFVHGFEQAGTERPVNPHRRTDDPMRQIFERVHVAPDPACRGDCT